MLSFRVLDGEKQPSVCQIYFFQCYVTLKQQIQYFMLLLLLFAIATATEQLGKNIPFLNTSVLILYPRFPWLLSMFCFGFF